MCNVSRFVYALIVLGILLLSTFASLSARGEAVDAGVPTTTETEKGIFVRQLLSARKLRVGSCRFAETECKQLMDEFVKGEDVDFLEPTLRSDDGQDAQFRKLVSQCLPPPAKDFFDSHEFYRATVGQVGGGNAVGPFAVYNLPALSAGAHQATVLLRMNGFRFQSGDPGVLNWTKYARLDLKSCAKGQDDTWLFQLGDDTSRGWKVYSTDGVARSIHAYTTDASPGRRQFARGESGGGAGGRCAVLPMIVLG